MTETYSPVPIDNAPATSAATPVSTTACAGTPPPLTSAISEALVTSHSTAPKTVSRLPQPYAGKVASLRQLAGTLTGEITLLDKVLGDLLDGREGYRAIQALPGIGPVLAAVIVAEIGDIRRFPGPGQLGSWAGLTPRHYESDLKVIRGHVTKQGSRILRWAVTEAIQRQPAGSRPRQVKDAIIARRGKEAKNIAKIAAARELLTLVFYGMRDGGIRRPARQQPPPAA